jgi:hypothetical protein
MKLWGDFGNDQTFLVPIDKISGPISASLERCEELTTTLLKVFLASHVRTALQGLVTASENLRRNSITRYEGIEVRRSDVQKLEKAFSKIKAIKYERI